jgi:hypothetical protein
MLMWGPGFRQCGRPPLPLDFVSLDIAAILPVVATVVAFSRDVQQSAAGPPLPWTFAGGFSTCCISRLPPKWWSGVQQCIELVCDTPHMVYLGQCKRFCNPFIAVAGQTEQWLGRRFGGAGAPSDRRRHDRLRRLGGLQAQVAPRFASSPFMAVKKCQDLHPQVEWHH